MEKVKFENGSLHLDAFILKDGRYAFHGNDTCKGCDLTGGNTSRWIKSKIPEKWRMQIAYGMGRPAIYLLESGLYYAMMNTITEDGVIFRDWVLEEVLPSIRSNGFYIDKDAVSQDNEKLQLLQKETLELSQKLEVSENLNFELRTYIDTELEDVKTQTKNKMLLDNELEQEDDNFDPLVFTKYKKRSLQEKLDEIKEDVRIIDEMVFNSQPSKLRTSLSYILTKHVLRLWNNIEPECYSDSNSLVCDLITVIKSVKDEDLRRTIAGFLETKTSKLFVDLSYSEPITKKKSKRKAKTR